MKRMFFLLCIFGCVLANAQQTLTNVPYLTGAAGDEQMDLYLPSTKNFKTIVYVHEGGLMSGDKKDEPYAKIAEKFQRDGFAFILINYRLGPANKWPAQPDDVCVAFACVKKHISAYGGDSSKVFIAGHSSGAFLTSLVCTDTKYMAKQGFALKNIAGFIVIGSQLKAVYPAVPKEKLVAFFQKNSYLSIFGDTAVYADAQAMAHINAAIPPGLFIIAEKEQFEPPILEQTQEFIEKAKPYNLDISYKVITGRTHMSNITKMPEDNDEVYALIKNFVDKH